MPTDELRCDNYDTCREKLRFFGDRVTGEARARAKGWHIFRGFTCGGTPHEAMLGPICVGPRRLIRPAPGPLPGQELLWKDE
jgi:hypothetical protein